MREPVKPCQGTTCLFCFISQGFFVNTANILTQRSRQLQPYKFSSSCSPLLQKTARPKYKEIKTEHPWATQWYKPSKSMGFADRLNQPQKIPLPTKGIALFFPLLLPNVHALLTSCKHCRDHRRTWQVRSACSSSWKLIHQKGEGLASWTKVGTTGHVIPNTCTLEGAGPHGWYGGEGRAPLSTKA